MLTRGVDLAAQPAGTAACELRWDAAGGTVPSGSAGSAKWQRPRVRVERLEVGLDDDALLGWLGPGADRVGVDAPFGWPDAFVDAVTAHREGRPWPGRGLPQGDYRRTLAQRCTDRETARVKHPLSVSTDRIAVTTMRLAALFDRLAAAGDPVDRSGGGRLCEVYPAATLVRFGLTGKGAKGPDGPAVRERLLGALAASLPLGLDDHRPALVRSDHAFDALVAALAARAVALGRTHAPAPEHRAQAQREGWIHLPCAGSLAGLADTQPKGCVCSPAT